MSTPQTCSPEILLFKNDAELAQAAAVRWLEKVAAAKAKNELHLVALSGGRITKAFFNAVVQLVRSNGQSMEHVHFFWADERCVPPTDPESNFAMADELLFRPLAIHPRQIHRLRGEAEPHVAVESATFELNATAGANGVAQLDMVFLGMGEDGHIASLFPNASEAVITCPAPFLHIDNSPKPPPKRISLSYAAIRAAKEVWVLISGAGKQAALEASLKGTTPLGRVLQQRKETKIFTDVPVK